MATARIPQAQRVAERGDLDLTAVPPFVAFRGPPSPAELNQEPKSELSLDLEKWDLSLEGSLPYYVDSGANNSTSTCPYQRRRLKQYRILIPRHTTEYGAQRSLV
jgi:hypothetical protein